MIHPHTALRFVHSAVGMGVVATEPIPCGTIMWVADALDQVLTPERVASLPSACTANLERYTWQDAAGNLILVWDLARFVNHSCDPNCLTTPGGFEIAVRDIGRHEEITNDYADLGLQPSEHLRCHCESPRCRGTISRADAEALRAYWNEKVAWALERVSSVVQPLQDLLEGAHRLHPAVDGNPRSIFHSA